MTTPTRPAGYRSNFDLLRPSRAVRSPRKRAGALTWPASLLGEPSAEETEIFGLLAGGMSPAAGALDALQLGQLVKSICILRGAQARLARAGTLLQSGDNVVQNPDVKTVAALSGCVLRGLQAAGLSPILLDRAPKIEGGDEGEGTVDDTGIFWPADGSPGYFVGKTEQQKASVKVVKFQPKPK